LLPEINIDPPNADTSVLASITQLFIHHVEERLAGGETADVLLENVPPSFPGQFGMVVYSFAMCGYEWRTKAVDDAEEYQTCRRRRPSPNASV
jgi:hypothetical protein